MYSRNEKKINFLRKKCCCLNLRTITAFHGKVCLNYLCMYLHFYEYTLICEGRFCTLRAISKERNFFFSELCPSRSQWPILKNSGSGQASSIQYMVGRSRHKLVSQILSVRSQWSIFKKIRIRADESGCEYSVYGW